MTTLAWWHCFAGIAGDMALGSLIDAGVDLATVERELSALPIDGWELEARDELRSGLACTSLVVHTRETSVVRTHGHIVGIITEARLPERVRDRALATFARLAEVEGSLHRRPPDRVHFHEVGGLDAIVDVVGTCIALEVLGIDDVYASPVAQGRGMVRSAHGLLPVPAPAVVELLIDAPTYGIDVPYELTTPTGAALLASLSRGWGPLPPMRVMASGYGAGRRDMDQLPNVVQVVVGEALDAGPAPESGQPVVLLEANVDDVTGEILADTIAALITAGAHDAWVTPIVGKKGRPAHVMSALVDVGLAAYARGVIADHTGTLGVRGSQLQRWPAARVIDHVEVEGQLIGIKRAAGRVKAEHDDAVKAAARLGIPVREVLRRAEERAHAEPPGPFPD
jgi:uncharacterized protein (TIGR00299 family) protein